MILLTWNTQWCCGMDGVVSPARIVQRAREIADFDVLCLQEIAVNYPGLRGAPAHDQAKLIASLLPGYQVFFGAAVDEWTAAGRQRFGNLIATRLPVHQVRHHPLPYPADADVRSMPRICTVVTLGGGVLGPVRVMTTHLEYYSRTQRMAQARALRELHAAYCQQAWRPPRPSEDGSPFQTKVHTAEAILCGDFNMEPHEPEYVQIQAPIEPGAGAVGTSGPRAVRLWDSHRVLHGDTPHAPTFRLEDRTYGPEPGACDFVFVSDGLKDRLLGIEVDEVTRASDHQPVLARFG